MNLDPTQPGAGAVRPASDSSPAAPSASSRQASAPAGLAAAPRNPGGAGSARVWVPLLPPPSLVSRPPPDEVEAVETLAQEGDEFTFQPVVFKRQTPVLGIEVTDPDLPVQQAWDMVEQVLHQAKHQGPVLPFRAHHDFATEGPDAGLENSTIELNPFESIEIRTRSQVLRRLIVKTVGSGDVAIIMGDPVPAAPAVLPARPKASQLKNAQKEDEVADIRALGLPFGNDFKANVALIQAKDDERLDKPSWNDHSIAMVLDRSNRRETVAKYRQALRSDGLASNPQVMALRRFDERITLGVETTQLDALERMYVEGERRLPEGDRYGLPDLCAASGSSQARAADFIALMQQDVDTPAIAAIRQVVRTLWRPEASIESVVDQVVELRNAAQGEDYRGLMRPSIHRIVNKVLLETDREHDARAGSGNLI